MTAFEFAEGYSAYLLLVVLFAIGLYGMMMKQNLIKKIMGMSIVQSSVILFFIVSAYKDDATVSVIDYARGVTNPDLYLNPLPHTLMLTAIVVAVVTLGVSFALVIMIYKRFKTLHEPTLRELMK
ncbi:MAG: cation:proton antiporter subunit C [Desulfobacterales bacterium]|jgi:multicomponent Na+:H+ antiporter subunit C|nr:cation:proton antiporter subunit C [Desulfobacterales bacterium]